MKTSRIGGRTDETPAGTSRSRRPLHAPLDSRWAMAVLAVALLPAGVMNAQLPLESVGSPFDMVGFIQSATVDTPGDVLSGGTLLVNNHTVIVPRNTIMQMPAFALTWQQLFSMAPPPYGPNQTGLAMADNPTPLTTYEIHVQGNRVGDTYIAGLLFLSQQSLNSGQGFINFIDYANHELRVGGIIGNPATGSRIRINDPIGRFAPAFNLDPRFTIDLDNPTVRTNTGYPLCFPHKNPTEDDDPLCPQRNRPINPATGFPQSIFTMQNPGPSLPGPAVGTNAWFAAPFKVGDYVTYAGTLLKDGGEPSAGPLPASGFAGTYIAANTIIADIGIFTAPGTRPAYIATDVMILGVGGLPINGLPQEATVRTRFEGFSTDPSRLVSLWGMDENACTGATSDRSWGLINVDQGPPTGAVLGRWRFRPPSKVVLMPPAGTFLPATRMMRASINGAYNAASPVVSGNGLITGQYNAPIFNFLFPENLAIGNPPVPLNLNDFPFLVNGTFSFAGAHVGQLSPWPAVPVPTPLCAPPLAAPPTANAGPAQTTTSGATVTLNGTASSDPNNLSLAFTWTQTAGPTVTLNSAFVAQPSFTAPPVPPPATSVVLTFQLLVTNTLSLSSLPSTVNITVNPAPVGTAPAANAGAAQTVGSGQVVQLNGTGSSDTNIPAQPLTFAWVQTGFGGLPSVTLSNPNVAAPTFTAPLNTTAGPVSLTFQLTVTNTVPLSNGATVTITVNRVLAPVANAGPNQTVSVGSLVTLNGTASSDPNGLPLTYSWTQVGGAAIALSSTALASPTFTAPAGQASASFQLIVNNGFLSSPASVVTITFSGQADVVTITLVEYRTSKQRLTVTATSSVTDGTPVLTLAGYGPSGTGLVIPFVGGGTYTVVLSGVPRPATVTVNSSLGGTRTSPLTSLRP